MSHYTNDEIRELTERVNARLAEWEFPPGVGFLQFSRGHVRLIADVLDTWADEQDDEGPVEEYVEARRQAYNAGYEAAKREMLAPEMSPAREEAEDKRDAAQFQKRVLANVANGRPAFADTGDLLGEQTAQEWQALSGVAMEALEADRQASAPVREALEQLVHGNTPLAEPEPVPELSAQAAATLGPEHTLVTPLIPRRAAPVAQALATGVFDLTPRTPKQMAAHKVTTVTEHLAATKGKKGKDLPSKEEIIAHLQKIAMANVMPGIVAFDATRPGNWATAQAQMLRLGVSWKQLASKAGLTYRGKAGNS